VIEITVKIKSEDTTIAEKFLVYEPFLVSPDDPFLKDMIGKTLTKTKEPLVDPEIIVKINCFWQ
jgi:hypothetical protein